MKLKRYTQFIKESLKEDIEEGKLWKLSEDDIREYLTDLIDNNYLITITFGFLEKITKNYYNKPSEEVEVFTEKVVVGNEVRPCYWIQIESTRKVKSEDVTDTIRFTVDMIEEHANAECQLHDRDGQLDIDSIQVKGGLFVDGDLEVEDYMAIFAKQKDSIVITQEQIENFYGWNVEVKKDGFLYAEIDLEDLADKILYSKSDYKDSLVKGQEHMWDYYEIHYYYPEINSLFQYDLNKENERLLVKSIIKELGGLEQTISFIGDECDNEIYEKTKAMSEEELIEYLLTERFYETIKQLGNDSEVLREVRDTIANWEMSAHCDDNYQEIVDEFDSIVEDELGQYEKVVKEVTKYYTSKDAEGNPTRREYKDNVTYYQFPYKNEWIEEVDSEYLYNKDLDDLFRDWVSEQSINRELRPRISDYGSVDKAKMNEDIKAYLNRYLGSNS